MHRQRFLLLAIAALLLAQIIQLQNLHHRHAAAVAQAPVASTYVIDVDAQTLPVEIKAAAGSEILLVRKEHIVGTDVSLETQNTDGGHNPLLSNKQAGTAAPQGYTLVSVYKVDRAGKAAIIVTHRVPMPGAKPSSDTIKVIGQ